MNGERPWAVDTVALGRGQTSEAAAPAADTTNLRSARKGSAGKTTRRRSQRTRRGGRRQGMTALVLGLAVVVAVASVARQQDSGSTAGTKSGVSAPRAQEARGAARPRRRKQPRVRRAMHRRRPGKRNRGALEDERARISTARHGQPSQPEAEATQVPEVPTESAPQGTPRAAPAPSRPTPPAAEFGL